MDTPELIKTVRIQLGMSQHALATAIHVAFSTVNRWENNRTTPNSIALLYIADYCEKHGVSKELVDELRSKGR